MLDSLLYKGIITDIICSLRSCLEFSEALTLLFSETLRSCLEFSGALRIGLVRRCALV